MNAARSDLPVLRLPDELTAGWLGEALDSGAVDGFELESIGTGQMSESARVRVRYGPDGEAGPASVVLKTASADDSSRATGVGLGAYEREIRFYRQLAPRIGGALAGCHVAVIDHEQGWFTLLLEDVAPAEQGDQIAGCDLQRASLAVHELAALHAPVFGDPQLGATPWLNQPSPLNQTLLTQLMTAFLDRYGERIDPQHQEICRSFFPRLDAWIADRRPPLGLVHGDYRLDNMLFGADGATRPFVIVDWQTAGWGPVMTDLAYFLGGSLSPADRRAHEQRLVRDYYDALQAHGVRGFDWDECWRGYRLQTFLGLVMTVAPAMLVERTERGDEMFLTTLARYAEQVIDLDSLELLPAAGAGRPPALRPDPADEARHPPGPERLWNESWYFDVVSEDCRTGLYTRIGLYPNLGVCWLTALLCGPDRPTVAVIDYAVPLPAGEGLTVATGSLRAEHDCEAALERFRVRLQAGGQQHGDAAELLRDEPGEPVELSFDLTWETLGVPYAYRVATRYEIPCRVHGTVNVGEETIPLQGLGQRDHSWGPRDWWSADWVWSAGHLEDGTRLHGVEFRIPGAPPIGVGYVQPPSGPVEELDAVSASEQARADGLIAGARIAYGELSVEVEPLAFGPLRLQATDGRVAEFPRAMCRLLAADGRSGAGWVEWNRNRPSGSGG
ncbi:MAG: phosphotransferase [Solirubrobacteraceae bacterium]